MAVEARNVERHDAELRDDVVEAVDDDRNERLRLELDLGIMAVEELIKNGWVGSTQRI
jgi:hypothetical protein